jgi:hypothetical protein
MFRSLLALLAGVCLLGTVGAGTVAAAPINNPGAQVITVDCDNGQQYMVIIGVGGNGRGTDGVPAFILDSNSHLMPVQFTFSDPAIGLNQISTVGQGNRTGQQNSLMACRASFPDGQGGSILLTVVARLTPG